MAKLLRVLNIEDSDRDALLLTHHLSAAGYDIVSERVETPEAMNNALAAREWDIVLCDYSMPKFNALAALEVLRLSGIDIPFIIISGTVGEDVAVEAMLTGADDYLSKDNLSRLVPAVERELHEARGRDERRQIEFERKIVFEIIQGIITTPTLDEFLKLVHRSISQIVYAKNCYVALHDPTSDVMDFALWIDSHDPWPPPKRRGKGLSNYVLSTGKPLRLTKELRQQLLREGVIQQTGTASASWLGVPLRTSSRTVGVLVLQHYEEEDAYSDRDLEFIASVGDQIAVVIERKRAEEALTESEERYRDLVENAIDIIYTHDLDGNYTSVNRASERITGYTQEESLSMSLADTIVPESIEKARQMISAKLAGDDVTAYELEITAKDGRRIAVEVNTRIILDKGIPIGVQGTARDVTYRKQLEEQLRQSQKLEGIGQLAGGIAHDFNNILTAVIGHSELVLRKIDKDDPLRANVEQIKNAGERSVELIRQLLAFSRKQVLQPKVLDLNTVVLDIEKMLGPLIKSNIELQTRLDPRLKRVKADPVQMEQVLLNLVVNAGDAMPDGGRLTIETQNAYLKKDFNKHSVIANEGPYVLLSVSDSGIGIDEPSRQRIFEPFFTTKELGKGTGLGLATVYGIVKQSSGYIWVDSEPGDGTTFRVYLPVYASEDTVRS